MRYFKTTLTLAIAVFIASLVMFIIGFFAGEGLGGPIFTTRLILVLILLSMLIPLVMRLDKKTWQRKLWGFITLAIVLVIIPIVMETINAYAGRKVFTEDLIFLFYLLVFIPILIVVGIFYYGFRAMGFRFTRKAATIVLPALLVLTGAAVAVLMIPLATGSESTAVAISDIFSLLVQLAAVYLVSMMAVTIGKGRMGRPYIFLSIALVCIIIQTILTAHIRLVGMLTPTALADLFVHLGYLFLIFAAYYQYEIVSESM
jgi:hypothetical protein